MNEKIEDVTAQTAPSTIKDHKPAQKVENQVNTYQAYQLSEPVEVDGKVYPSQSMVVTASGGGQSMYMTEADYKVRFARVPGTDQSVVVEQGDVERAVKVVNANRRTAPQGQDSRPITKIENGIAVSSDKYDPNSDTLPPNVNKAAPVTKEQQAQADKHSLSRGYNKQHISNVDPSVSNSPNTIVSPNETAPKNNRTVK